MKTHLLFVPALAMALAWVTVADAQYDTTSIYSAGPANIQAPATTAHEGALRGQAAVIESMGRYNHETSLAEINHQDAVTKHYQNEVTKVETYFEKRSKNRAARAAEKRPRPTPVEIARYARLRAPQGLDSSQYQPETKQVYWPDVLMLDYFARERILIDRLVAQRNLQTGGIGSREHHTMKVLTDKMKKKLKAQVKVLTPAEYVLAKRYISGIEVEFQSAMLPSSVAQN